MACFVRFAFPGRGPSLGLVGAEAGAPLSAACPVRDLTALAPEGGADPLPWLRRLSDERARAELAAFAARCPVPATLAELEGSGCLLPPVPAPEVWAAGVTYERSRDARDRESQVSSGGETPYDRVYTADRPELFLKATAARLTPPGGPAGLRGDSRWQVPEAELGLVLDEDASILGYTLGNDLSARDIEGANPLYLPQAKIFRCSCAIGPTVLAAAAAPAGPFALACRILRGGRPLWSAETSTAAMRRDFASLARWLARHNWVLAGTVLLTGTGLVPPDEVTLQPGDVIEISSPALGVLRNVAAPV